MRQQAQRGFTLLEIVVVVAIIALLATVLVIKLPNMGGGGRQLDEEMRRFTTLIELAGEEAVLQGRDLGVYIDRSRYSFHAFDPDSQTWQPLPEELRERELPEGITFDLVLEGRPVTLGFDGEEGEDEEQPQPGGRVPQVLILSSGELTPFTLTIESEFVDYQYLVTGLPYGGTEVKLEE